MIMELDELKDAWVALDSKLKKNEALNERIIKEMLRSKTSKELNRLHIFELFNVTVCFIGLPLLVFVYSTMKHTLWMDITVYFLMIFLFLVCITQSYKLWLLIKIDTNNPVGGNIKLFHKYDLFIKREKIASYIYGPILITLAILAATSLEKLETWRLVALIILVPLAIVMTIWQYKRIYGTNLKSIKNSLEELKNLEE